MNNKFIIIFFILIIISGCSFEKEKVNLADKGVLDLRHHDFSKRNSIVKLQGEWEFYWEKILSPEDFATNYFSSFEYKFLPQVWNNYAPKSENIQNFGYATYRLKIIFDEENLNQIFGLKIKEIESATKVYIDDNEVIKSGQVAINSEEAVADIDSKFRFFKLDNDTVDIILQISNFHHRDGGIRAAIELGNEDDIISKNLRLKFLDMFLGGILIIMMFYHISIHLLRKKERSSLLFAVFCFIIFIRLVTTGERILLDVFPEIPYKIYFKIEYFSFFMAIPITLHFLNSFFPKEFNKKIFIIAYFIGFAFTFFSIVTHSSIACYAITPYQIILIIGIIYCIGGLIFAVHRKRKFSILISIGILVLIITALNDVAYTHELIKTKFLTVYGFAIMIFINSYVLSKKFTDAFNELEDLSENLELKVNTRTLEIAKKNQLLEEKNQKIATQNKILEDSFNNLKFIGEIGKSITVNLSVKDILQSIYKQLNELMEASIVAFGLIDDSQKKLFFHGIEDGNYEMTTGCDYINDMNQLSVWCFKNQKDIFINDFDTEFYFYIPHQIEHLRNRKSLIYSPITFKDKRLGVFTVQSYNKNAYNQNHLQIINNITIYTAIALENANSFKILNSQNVLLEKNNAQIHSSLSYASRIQNAILPKLNIESHLFLRNFVFYRPRDLVSGDFYWYKNFGRFSVIAAADCTGHGVPGAIMSMLGISFLNEIVNRRNLTMPGQILNELRASIKSSLKQTGEIGHSQDGMDIAFCSINIESKTLYFAGANNPLWLFREDEFIEIKADRQPVGIYFKENPFTEHSIQLNEDDVFYIFSDGFHSQFGGSNMTKYKLKRFKNLLKDIHKKTVNEQKEILINEFDSWKNNYQQTDDVLVIGLQII